MNVNEIMVKDIISIKPDGSAKEALDLLQKMNISGLPVIDDKNKLVGMFTEKEVLTKILPSYVGQVGAYSYLNNPKAIIHKVAAFNQMKVKDVMRQEVITVTDETSIYEVAHVMLAQKARRIVVLDKDKNVVGIVGRGDVTKAIFDTQNKL